GGYRERTGRSDGRARLHHPRYLRRRVDDAGVAVVLFTVAPSGRSAVSPGRHQPSHDTSPSDRERPRDASMVVLPGHRRRHRTDRSQHPEPGRARRARARTPRRSAAGPRAAHGGGSLIMKRPAVIALLLGALILAACGQKAGVHVASGRNGASLNNELGSEAGGGTGSATGGGESAAAAAGGAAGAAGGSAAAAGGTRAGAGGRAGSSAAGGGTSAAGGPGDSTGITDNSITIGLHAPVTGAAPFPTTSFQDGKDLYFNYLNDKGGINGRKVNVVFEDDGYNPGQAVSKCKKMVQQDHVFMLVGGGGTDQIVACAQYAASVGVPYLAEGVSEQGLNTLQNYFALSMTYKAQGPLLAQYMKNVLHVTKVGMIRGNTANFDDAHAGFLQAAAANGLQIVADKSIDKNADSATAFAAGGSLCAGGNKPEAVYPLIAPSIWVQI